MTDNLNERLAKAWGGRSGYFPNFDYKDPAIVVENIEWLRKNGYLISIGCADFEFLKNDISYFVYDCDNLAEAVALARVEAGDE